MGTRSGAVRILVPAAAAVAVAIVVLTVLAGLNVQRAPTASPAPSLSIAATKPCDGLATSSLANTKIDSAATSPAAGATPESCRVHATVSHPGANDAVGIDVWMPTKGWNGRFLGVGGGGYTGGTTAPLGAFVAQGYAAASSDLGHSPAVGGTFALNKDNTLNWPLIRDFGYIGLHDLAVTGKAIVAAYYGQPATYSYWNGCSTGGRQGLMEAQRYPQDYNGILAAAPAINWARFIPAELWPQVVMQRDGNFMPQCKFDAYQAAAIRACDTVGDGVADGVIGDPLHCNFDPKTLVGTDTPCGKITAQDAAVIAKIFAGPRSPTGDFLWFGLTPGASFAGLANTQTTALASYPLPFSIAVTHLGTWTQQNPAWDWTPTTYERFEQLFVQSKELFSEVIGTENADLSAFAKAGGKVVIWHGLADQLIFPQGTVDYYQRVQAVMGGDKKTQEFARLFLAPGVAHCAGGPGPQPDSPLNAVVDWVERGVAPDTLSAVLKDQSGAIKQTRPICQYPSVAAYTGSGDPMAAASFACQATEKK